MLELKDVLKPRLKHSSSGGEEFQPDKYLTDRNSTVLGTTRADGTVVRVFLTQFLRLWVHIPLRNVAA